MYPTENGIVDSASLKIREIHLAFFQNRVAELTHAFESHPAFIVAGEGADKSELVVDWGYYRSVEEDDRPTLHNMLWAAGILTSIEFQNLRVREKERSRHRHIHGPRATFQAPDCELFFARGHAEQGHEYIASYHALNCPELEFKLELAQLIAEPQYNIVEKTIVPDPATAASATAAN